MKSAASNRLKGLKRYSVGGSRYSYHRSTGKRLPDLPETHPEFLAAYLRQPRPPTLLSKSPATASKMLRDGI